MEMALCENSIQNYRRKCAENVCGCDDNYLPVHLWYTEPDSIRCAINTHSLKHTTHLPQSIPAGVNNCRPCAGPIIIGVLWFFTAKCSPTSGRPTSSSSSSSVLIGSAASVCVWVCWYTHFPTTSTLTQRLLFMNFPFQK